MTPQTIAALVLSVLCFTAGWRVEGWRKAGELERCESAYVKQRANDLEQHLADLTEAEKIGQALAARVATTENQLTVANQEKTDAIRRLTAGRHCLDRAAVRVLNGPRPPSGPAGLKATLPETTGQPVPADAAFATDTDVGLWIGQAQRAYDTCRGRLDAIADYYNQDDHE